MSKKRFILILLTIHVFHPLFPQKKITVEDIYAKGIFKPETVTGVNWMQDGQYYTTRLRNKIVKFDITTGNDVETLFDGSKYDGPIVFTDYSFNSREDKLLILTQRRSIYRRSFIAYYYIYDLVSKKLTPLSLNGPQSYATFSPDASKVAFVRTNDLYYIDLKDMSEYQVTNDGKFNHIINGNTDWVYEEEFYLVKAFFWSPDGQKLAYYKFDESDVKQYNMQVWNRGALYPLDYKYKYPKAGEENSKVEIYIFDLGTNKHLKVQIGEEEDIYIPRVQWTKDPNILSIRKMNRLQNKLELLHADARTGETETILTETSDTYIHLNYTDDIRYLEDGQHFLHSSSSDGYKHFYLYNMDGSLVRQITKGAWEAEEFVRLNEDRNKLYFLSTEDSPLERHLYVIDLDGKNKKRLSVVEGVHEIDMSKDCKYYMDFHSNLDNPLEVTLFRVEANQKVKVLESNKKLKDTLEAYGIVKKEFFDFETVDGTRLNGFMLKPADFDPTKKYPLLIYQYSGPGSQQVMKSWEGRRFYWHQMLTQHGYIIATIDPRGTGGRGTAFKKITYGQLGKYESIDQIEGAKYLANLDFIDGTRIGIWGWSYGGYMSALCMFKGEGLFKAAISIAPVTNWRYYDTIYTERYMGLPQDNPNGYDDNSPVSHAEKLQGAYLLVHGTADDNVHFQNTVALQDALISSNKKFQSFFYPDRAHSIARGNSKVHLYRMMADFILKNL